ncbi:MAG: hypothetical protein HYX39_09835 [Bacteroidetes bacterium]|nr:hypothetical protein [Bacteroidota bacterium]
MKYILTFLIFGTLISCDEDIVVDPFAVSDHTRDSIYLKVNELTSNLKYDDAEKLLGTIRARDIYDQDYFYLMSNVKTHLNKQSEAIHYLRLALRVSKQKAAIHYLLAERYGAMNMKDSAIVCLNRAIAEDTLNQGYLRARTKYYIDNQLPILALDDANRLLRIDSSVNNVLYRARCTFDIGDTSGAFGLYQLVYNRHPDNLDAIKYIGFIYSYQKKNAKAKEYFNKYLNLDPTNGDVFFQMAIILSNENKIDKACDCLLKAMEYGDEDAYKHAYKCEEQFKKRGIEIKFRTDSIPKQTKSDGSHQI